MSFGNLDINDSAPAGKVSAGDSLFNNIDFSNFNSSRGNDNSTASGLPQVSVDTSSLDLQTIEPYFMNLSAIDFGSAEEFAQAGVEPDFIMGADGQIRQNPNKEAIGGDGNLRVQVEGKDVQSLQSANEAQKASIRELIRYFQKYNPGRPVPQEWTDKLHAQADVPQHTSPSPQGDYNPYMPANPGGGYRGGGGGGGGGYRGGGGGGGARRGGGARPDFSPGDGGLRPQPIGPRGNIESFRPVPGDIKLEGPPTITPEKIDEVLKSYGSPATGLGKFIYDEGVRTGINPAVALAFFIQESSAGTAGVARTTKSWGNIKAVGNEPSYKGFRAYNTYEEGITHWYNLISDRYLAPKSEGGRGYEYLSQVIGTYAPASDNNDERAYVANVKGMVQGWERSLGDQPRDDRAYV